jgi:ERCC4-type nuclease
VQIVADVQERRSGVPDALIERKSVHDKHLSLVRGRPWPQIGRLRHAAAWRYLLIEGESLYTGPVAAEAIRGALITIDELGIGVIRASDAADAAARIARIALRRHGAPRRDRPHYAQRPQRDTHGTPSERALAAVHTVATGTSDSGARRNCQPRAT